MATIPGVAKDLKEGRFVIIEGEPCKVVEIQTSAPGKHGAAKMRIVGIGIFDNVKRTLLKPSDGAVEIPIVERKIAQVIAVAGNVAQLMDPQTYEMFELQIPNEMLAEVAAGKEAELLEYAGKKLLQRVR